MVKSGMLILWTTNEPTPPPNTRHGYKRARPEFPQRAARNVSLTPVLNSANIPSTMVLVVGGAVSGEPASNGGRGAYSAISCTVSA
jgi:hypothetical protein